MRFKPRRPASTVAGPRLKLDQSQGVLTMLTSILQWGSLLPAAKKRRKKFVHGRFNVIGRVRLYFRYFERIVCFFVILDFMSQRCTLMAAEDNIPAHVAPIVETLSTPPSVSPPSSDEISSETVHLPELPPDLIPEHYVDGFDGLKFPSDPFFAKNRVSDDMGHANNAVDSKPHPPGRWLHTANAINDEIIIYGGVSNSRTLLNDVWIMNPTEGSWWKLEPATRPTGSNLNNVAGLNNNMHERARIVDAARPESMPPSPPMQLPPGVKQKVPLGESFEDEEKNRMERKPRTIRISPVPMEAPAFPLSEGIISARPDTENPKLRRRRRRRRRLQGQKTASTDSKPGSDINELAVPPAVYNALDIHAPRLVDDLWIYNLGTRQWYRPPDPPNVGSEAALEAAAAGGANTATKSASGPKSPSQIRPKSRWLHASVTIETGASKKKKLLVIFGGLSSDMMVLNDVWSYDPEINKWNEIIYEGDTEMQPLGREGHSMVSWKSPKGSSTGLIFGGISYDYKPFDDLYELTIESSGKTSKWKKLNAEAKPDPEYGFPEGRWMHASVAAEVSEKTGSGRKPRRRLLMNGAGTEKKVWRMYIHGGCNKDYTPLDDLWHYTESTKQWVKVITGVRGGSYPPPARWLHSANLILIEDFEIASKEAETKRRRRLSGFLDAMGSNVGGAPGRTSTDIPVPNIEVGILVFGGASTNSAMQDQWLFNTKDETWTEWHPSTDFPMAREGHTCTTIGGTQFEDTTDDGKRRRRRLLQDDPDITEAIEGPDVGQLPSYDPRAERFRPMQASNTWMFVFGGSGEQGNVEAQMA